MDACSLPNEQPILVTEEERTRRTLSEANFRQAALLLHTRGYVIFKGAIPIDLAEEASRCFEVIFRDCVASKNGDGWYQVARETQAVFWERNYRWRIFPKLRYPFGSSWISANPFALQLLRFLLGPDFYCKFVSSDTCLKGAVIQSPHRELGAGAAWTPRAYVVNVPLCYCGLENGPLEVWYGGSHLWRNEVLQSLELHDDVQDGENPEMERLAAMFPSRRIILEPGDLLVRDPGLLHRGTVNQTDAPRSMLTVCYFRKGEDHSYGNLEYSLDREIWQTLESEVRDVFAYAFSSKKGPSASAPESGVPSPPEPAVPASGGFWRPWFKGRAKSVRRSTHSSQE
jgi:ectoine hydroxylase-related dioxygenase (phytanoyl-CoA dioxygenase family)